MADPIHQTDPQTADEKLEYIASNWARIQPMLTAIVRSMVFDPYEADDLIQNVAMVVVRKRDTFTPGTSFNAWVSKIARYEILAWRRTKKTQGIEFNSDVIEHLVEKAASESEAWSNYAAHLEPCLRKLEGRPLEILSLRYRDSLAPQKIAGIMKISVNAVSQVLARTKTKLKDCVERRMRSIDQRPHTGGGR